MGKIYNCVRMKCKTLYQQIHALFSMGSELEDAVTSDINNFEKRLDDYADVNMQNSQDIQDLYESDSKIRITANKNKEDIDILKPKVAKNTDDIASLENEIGSIDLPGTIYNKINRNKLAIDEINSSDVMQSGINKTKVDQIVTNTADIVLNTADIVLNKQEIAKINNSDVMKSGINATKVTQIETNKNSIDTINTNIQGINTEIDGIKTSDVMTSGINTIKVNQIETNKNAIATANENITQNTNDISDIQTSDVMVSGINATKVGQIETNKNAIATANGNITKNTNAINTINNSDVMKSGINTTKVGQIETNRLAIVTANGEIEKNKTAINTINNSAVMKSGINSTIVQQVGTNKTGITTVNGRVDTLEESVNGLSGSVNTLEENVNNNTASINNISTDVNAMKTGKQDKLVAGSGITIASDGKTISAGTEKPWNVLDSVDNIHTLINVSTINGKSTIIVNKKIRFKITTYKNDGNYYICYYYTSRVLEPFSWQVSIPSNYNISIGFDQFSYGLTKGVANGAGIWFLISDNLNYDIDIRLYHSLINVSLALIKGNTSKINNTFVEYSTAQPVNNISSNKVYYCIEYQD